MKKANQQEKESMIYNFEDIDSENEEIEEWNKTLHLRSIDEMMAKLEQPPKPCEIFDCQSTYISGTRCACMREVFDNDQHLTDYQNFLYLLIGLLVTDTMLCGYVQKENQEE